MTLKFFESSCFNHCSAADRRKFPLQPEMVALVSDTWQEKKMTCLCLSYVQLVSQQSLEVQRKIGGRGGSLATPRDSSLFDEVRRCTNRTGIQLTVKIKVQGLKGNIDSIRHASHQHRMHGPDIRNKYLKDPSLNRLPQFHGTTDPSFSLCIRTTGFKIPGTAAEASNAVQISVSGAVM